MELWLDYLEASIVASSAILCFVVLSVLFSIRYRQKYKRMVWMLIILRLLVPVRTSLWENNYVVEMPVYTLDKNNETERLDNAEKRSEGIVSEKHQNIIDNACENGIITGNFIMLIWIAGMGLFFVYHFWVHKRACKKIIKLSYVCNDGNILACVQKIAEDIALKRVPAIRIMKGEKKSPFSVGIIYKIIYLPEIRYEEKDLNYVLRHEMIHCKNHDILLKVIMLLVNGIHWFNPFVWLMRMVVERDIELICDDEVLSTASKEECREYSEIIMACISADCVSKTMVSTGYIQGTKFIKYRFKNIFAKQKKKGGGVCFWIIMLIMLLMQGRVKVAAVNVVAVVDAPISFGIEIKADVDGDGLNDRIYVKDQVGGTDVHTQLIVQFANGESDFVTYADYWNSYLVSGDLDGDGVSDIVIMRGASGNGYGLGYVNVLHIVNGQWEEYPSVFIKNQSIELEQPDDFSQKQLGNTYVAATIIKEDDKTILRLILNEDIGNDIVSCIDCSWNGAGWYIEDIQKISDYYGQYRDLELLENNFKY